MQCDKVKKMLAEHNVSSKRGIIVKSQVLIKQYLMKSIVFSRHSMFYALSRILP